MSDLNDFLHEVELRLQSANREPFWDPADSDRYMSEVAARREHFERVSQHLLAMVVEPRLEVLARQFTNASLGSNDPAGHGSCRFGYCERFPVSARVEFIIEHDARFEKLSTIYDVWMMPLFIKFNQHDALSVPLENLDDGEIVGWVEERLLEYLDAYLRIDRGRDDFFDEAVTDPVCGMRIARSAAGGKAVYAGHAYFFCSEECQQAIAANPQSFAEVKTL